MKMETAEIQNKTVEMFILLNFIFLLIVQEKAYNEYAEVIF